MKSGDTVTLAEKRLSKALERDPIDALNDAEFLLRVLEKSTEALSLPSALDIAGRTSRRLLVLATGQDHRSAKTRASRSSNGCRVADWSATKSG